MAGSAPSALVIEQGRCVQFRLRGQFYELNQDDLRTALGLPPGPPGLGITIDQGKFQFEFAADGRTIALTAAQLQHRLSRTAASPITSKGQGL